MMTTMTAIAVIYAKISLTVCKTNVSSGMPLPQRALKASENPAQTATLISFHTQADSEFRFQDMLEQSRVEFRVTSAARG